MSARAFARVDMEGNLLTHSPEVLGMANCVYPSEGEIVVFGAYCFKLNFTPASVIANSIAHPNDSRIQYTFYTAGPNVSGNFTKDGNGSDVACPADFQDAAVICRSTGGGSLGLATPPGGFFVMFFD